MRMENMNSKYKIENQTRCAYNNPCFRSQLMQYQPKSYSHGYHYNHSEHYPNSHQLEDKLVSGNSSRCMGSRLKGTGQNGTEGLNFCKRKQLRMDSSKKLAMSQRARSLSTFVVPYNKQQQQAKYNYQLKQNIWLIPDMSQKHKIPQYSNSNMSMNICSRSSTPKFKNEKLQFKPLGNRKQLLLDWTKKQRKKVRRLTGLADYGKVQEQSTFDGKKQEHGENEGRFLLEFKRPIRNRMKVSQKNLLYEISQKTQQKALLSPQTFPQSSIFSSLKKSDFEIGKKLGHGNFSQAYLVRHRSTNFLFAMKVMKKSTLIAQNYQTQLIRQIKIQLYLRNKNIVQLYAIFEDEDHIYLLMEFCSHGHVFDSIRKNGRIQEEKCVDLLNGIGNGLRYMHQERVIHRDLKPENIFLAFDEAKIGDFGWAVYQGSEAEMRRTLSGSPLYFSPEIVQKQFYDQKIDIWGLGVIAYQCLIGMAPFKVYSVMNLDRIVRDEIKFPDYVDISQEAIDFIRKCLTKRGEDRWGIEQAIKHQFLKNKT